VDPILFFYLIGIKAAVVNVCSRLDFSICGTVHVKLHFFICCLSLCCNVGTLLIKGVGKVGCACHESMEVGESSIAALILNLSTRGKGVVNLKLLPLYTLGKSCCTQ